MNQLNSIMSNVSTPNKLQAIARPEETDTNVGIVANALEGIMSEISSLQSMANGNL